MLYHLVLKVGTFFEDSKLSVKQVFKLSYFWAQKYSIEHAVYKSGIAKSNVVEWYKKFRKVCSEYFLRNPIRLGGNVEIDETFMSRRHGRRGRRVRRHSKWLLTMVERGTNLSYIRVVYRRSAAFLLPIILRHVRPLSNIYTDEWRAYRALARQPIYRHRIINHGRNFVHPQDRTLHTQTIESKNGQWKKWVRMRNGLGDRSIRPHINEFLWRERFGRRDVVFYNFWHQVSALYPCNP
jgi:transposase-like protein